MNRTTVIWSYIKVDDIADLDCFVVHTHIFFPRFLVFQVDIFISNERLGAMKAVIPLKQVIISNMLAKMGSQSITSHVCSIEGSVIEGTGGCHESRCVCFWIQWDKFLVVSFVPD